jgi:hypothetical protein
LECGGLAAAFAPKAIGRTICRRYHVGVRNLTLPIIVESDSDGYFVSCPALQGCYSQGDTSKRRAKISETPSAYTSKIAKPTEKKFQKKFPSVSPPSKSPSNDQATRLTAREIISVLEKVGFSLTRQSGSHMICSRQASHGAVPFC